MDHEHYPTMLARFEAGAEQAKADLARVLHDELGGLLVAAVMDTAWAEQNLDSTTDARVRLKRARKSLSAAVDLKRGVIEQLRPTLFDNFGLIAALRWQHKLSCGEAELECTSDFPLDEPNYDPHVSIVLFRIAQETLAWAVRQPDVTLVHVSLQVDHHGAQLSIRHDGASHQNSDRTAADNLAMWLLESRVVALEGVLTLSHGGTDGAGMVARIPHRVLMAQHNEKSTGQAPTTV